MHAQDPPHRQERSRNIIALTNCASLATQTASTFKNPQLPTIVLLQQRSPDGVRDFSPGRFLPLRRTSTKTSP